MSNGYNESFISLTILANSSHINLFCITEGQLNLFHYIFKTFM